jgi:PAS domain S-box-containing protein
MKTTHKIVGCAVGVALLVALGTMAVFSAFHQLREAAETQSRSTAALASANDLLSDLKDAETGERGYVITADKVFLEPYFAAEHSIDGRLKELQQLSQAHNAGDHVGAAAPMIKAKMAELGRVVELVDKHDMPAATAMVSEGMGKREMDSIRGEIGAYCHDEEAALARHQAVFQSEMRTLFIVIAVGSALVILLALLLAYLAYREVLNRIRSKSLLETQRLLVIQKEISERLRQANESFQASEQRLSVTLQSIGDGLICTDANGRVTLLNPVGENLTGWTQAEAANRPVEEIFHIVNHETRNPSVIPVKETLAKGTIHGIENHTVLIARDGRECAIADSCAPIRDRDQTVVGAVLVFRDVTKDFLAQQAINKTNLELQRAKAGAEKANQAKSEFLSSMSHELRSPLNAILGFAQIMESDTPPPSAPQIVRITQILQAGWHLLNLIDEILDLSVIESGKMSLSREPVSLVELMSECRAMMEKQAQDRHIVTTFSGLDHPVYVWADRTRLKQIILNLLSNAIKYNKERGTIVVECGGAAPDRTRINVIDTGAGLNPAKMEQLFQPFNRLGQEGGGIAGTGIGLVVTKQLTELMKGTVGVRSTVGKGSNFWVELLSAPAPEPLADSVESAATTQTKPERPIGKLQRVLLYVEDNPANLMVVEQLVARCPNLMLMTAATGILGIEIARTVQPAVILMDINLPGMSGVTALQLLRADPVTAHIPVVAVSANAMPRDIKRGLDEGFYRYITKPIRVKEFMEVLSETLLFAEKQVAAAAKS